MSDAIERNGYTLDWLGGSCPVQAEGTIDGHPLYFRARGARWSLDIGEAFGNEPPLFWYREDWGTWPDAGYMPDDVALSMIDKAVALYREQKPEKIERSDPRWPMHILKAWSDEHFGTKSACECLQVDEDTLESMAADAGLPINSYHTLVKEIKAREAERDRVLKSFGMTNDRDNRKSEVVTLLNRGDITREQAAYFLHINDDALSNLISETATTSVVEGKPV